jgi:tagaturonate reductase
MQKLTRKTTNASTPNPERVLQFGGGNFLRAFADWIFDVYNEKTESDLGVLLVTPIASDNYVSWQEQEGLYHVLTRGFEEGQVRDEKHLVQCVSRILHLYPQWDSFLRSAENPDIRYVVSNTTEAGIRFSPEDKRTDAPPHEFPAKLTLWLHRRYQFFQGEKDKGCVFFPVELILENGTALRHCILQNAENWGLEAGFIDWINEANVFCNTLVDRIVPGISKDKLPQEWEKLGFQDSMMTQGEAFHFWAIEAPQAVREELPLDQVGLNVVFTDDLGPFRKRKVRILNGAHTALVPVGYLYGLRIVRDAVEDELTGSFLSQLLAEEVLPVIGMPREEVESFAKAVVDRFRNPFIDHYLISIALNSFSKFKSRLLPTVLDYLKQNQEPPKLISFALASTILFYKGANNGQEIPLNDNQEVLDKLQALWQEHGDDYPAIVQAVLAWRSHWGEDLTQHPGLAELVSQYMQRIEQDGIKASLQGLLEA